MSTPDQDVAARLTEAARVVTGSFSPDEVAAIVRYQARDRTYELVSAVLRAGRSPRELTVEQSDLVAGIIDALDVATTRWRVPEALRVYRGQRSVSRVFGTGARVGRVLDAETFLSTSIFRAVALEEFTTPPGAGGGALLEVVVAAGTPGLWLPPAGDPALAYQGELLLPRQTRIVVRAEREEASILVLDCEVLP